jgi:hypothetical protein
MDFTKYVAMIQSQTLFFSRMDALGDPFEGARSKANFERRRDVYGEVDIPEDALKGLSRFTEWARQWTYVNCWHMNNHESAAMWRLYAQTNEAVAIQSTAAKLCQVVPENTYVGMVEYIDYEHDWVPEGNSFAALVRKRKSFEHEKELRALISEIPVEGESMPVGKINSEWGKAVPIALNQLIENVYVAPSAPDWFAELVRSITARFGFDFPVIHSSLDAKPLF